MDKVTACINSRHTQRNIFIVCVYVLALVFSCGVNAGDNLQRVVVADPFIEMHSGPGKGYPIFHVVDRNDWVVVLKRKHDWIKVRSSDDKLGWVLIDQMQQTLTAPGVHAKFKQVAKEHFSKRSWEFGVMAGDFSGAALLTVYGAFNFQKNLATELYYTQVSGDFTKTRQLGIGLTSTPFPKWVVSPYFTIGGGYIENAPRKSFVFADTTDTTYVVAGAGLRMYLSRRLFMRLEIRENIVFIDDDANGEFREIKGGFSFFF